MTIENVALIVSGYLKNNHIRANEVSDLIAATHAALSNLRTPAEVEPVKLVPAVPVRKSVQGDYIISLEDGKKYKTLKRHLSGHGMTPEEYRAKWDLPSDYPMTAPNYAARRSELAKAAGLGRKPGEKVRVAEAPTPTPAPAEVEAVAPAESEAVKWPDDVQVKTAPAKAKRTTAAKPKAKPRAQPAEETDSE